MLPHLPPRLDSLPFESFDSVIPGPWGYILRAGCRHTDLFFFFKKKVKISKVAFEVGLEP